VEGSSWGLSVTYWTEEAADVLLRGCAELQVALTAEHEAAFARFAELILHTNQEFNLTSIKDPVNVATKLFVDSLTLISYFPVPENAYVLDMGTGAGMPGIPIKILLPHIRMAFVDSTRKKLEFVRMAVDELQLADCEFYNTRVEELAHGGLRERFDLVLVRAFGTLSEICEVGLPFVRINGRLVAYKGREDEEQERSMNEIVSILGGTVEAIRRLRLPILGHERTLVMIRKESASEHCFPRPWHMIKKKPLGRL
jgi:16S rRNA (guanine527-N7)-methyltransferase